MIGSIEELLIPDFKKQEVYSIVNIISGFLPNAEVYLFGSCANGVVSLDSDVDLIVLIDQVPTRNDRVDLRTRIDRGTGYSLEFDLLIYEKDNFMDLIHTDSFENRTYAKSIQLI